MTVIEFIEDTSKLCDEWEKGDRLPPDNESVPGLIEALDVVDRELRSIDMSNESIADQATSVGLLSILMSLKTRILTLDSSK